MLAGHSAVNAAQRKLVSDAMYGTKDLENVLSSFLSTYSSECLKRETLHMGDNLDQIDIIRE
jgi:hypothetical protein